jgi:protein-tyrosine phosphatase
VTFTILFVCTANQCRSPMAHRLAVNWLGKRFGTGQADFVVASAGTMAWDGIVMTSLAGDVLTELGVDTAGPDSRALTEAIVGDAGLVLTMERRHRSDVVTLAPAALKRAFTLTEFARTAPVAAAELDLPSSPVDRAQAVVAATARKRGTVRSARPDDDDIADPIGNPIDDYRRAIGEISTAVDTSLTALVGAPRIE